MYSFIKENAKKNDKVSEIISSIEKKYKISFPVVLSDFYKDYNDCKINLCLFNISGYECEVSKIIPIMSDGLTFEKIAKNDREDGFINNDLFPFAINRGGDTYYWSSKTEEIFLILADDIENPFKICNSVTEFFELLEKNNKCKH